MGTASSGRYSENEVKGLISQLIDAVNICVLCGIGHRDIKLQNITFPIEKKISTTTDGDRINNVLIKLADFGMASFAQRDGRLRGRCGTPGYVAPEILRAGVHETYDINVDIFSIGVVAYTLLCGYEPFYGTDDQSLIKYVLHS